MKVSPPATLHAAASAASLRIRTTETPADWQIAHSMYLYFSFWLG